MDYDWDSEKARSNLRKHDVDFADAVGVFEDEWALTIEQEVVDEERRFATLGLDYLGRVLVVIYTFRGNNIRVISARKAGGRERKTYERRSA